MKVVWLIGRFHLPEARGLVNELTHILPDATFTQVVYPSEAVSAGLASPDLIVVLQSWPGEFSQREAELLVASEPLAEVVVALGPWCASAQRSERYWPESVTVPWWRAASRVRLLTDANTGTQNRLPLTAGRDEAVSFDLEPVQPTAGSATVSIVTPDFALRELLSELCRASGAEVLPIEGATNRTIILWDVMEDLPASRENRPWRQSHVPANRTVAIVALPVSSTVERLRELGVDVVLPKPFSIAEFTAAIRTVDRL